MARGCGLQHPWTDLWISLFLLLASLSIYLSLISWFLSFQYCTLAYCRIGLSTTCTSSVFASNNSTPVPGYTADTHYSPLNMGPQRASNLPSSSVSTCASRYRLINRLLSRSNQLHSHGIIIQGTHQLPIAVIHLM